MGKGEVGIDLMDTIEHTPETLTKSWTLATNGN